jgi:23S rRNA (adenine2503-C2)-methyltransferase
MKNKITIFDHTAASFSQDVALHLGKGKQHARRLYTQWIRKGELDRNVEPQAASLVDAIIEKTDFSLPEISAVRDEGNTKKFLLKFHDGFESESVIIPMKSGATLCVSSQIGCKKACAFCETGRMGLLRNLKANEIIAQLFIARNVLKAEIRNIVFMGMGEPLDNFNEVLHAIEILTDPLGFGLGASHITVSTSGVVDKIERLSASDMPKVHLAVSVNASNDLLRQKLMPINRKWNMARLKEAMLSYCAKTKKKIFAEYVLIKDFNDSLTCAEELFAYLQELNVTVNLIPYNPQQIDRFAAPEQERVEAFQSFLSERGMRTLLRQAKGQAIMAACGQLGNQKLSRRIP